MGAPRSSAPPCLTLLLPQGAASVLASPRPLSRSVFDLFCLLNLYVIEKCGRFLKLAQSNSAICRSLFLLTKKLRNNCYSDSGVVHISFFFSRDNFGGEILQTCFSHRFFDSLTLNCNIRHLTFSVTSLLLHSGFGGMGTKVGLHLAENRGEQTDRALGSLGIKPTATTFNSSDSVCLDTETQHTRQQQAGKTEIKHHTLQPQSALLEKIKASVHSQ